VSTRTHLEAMNAARHPGQLLTIPICSAKRFRRFRRMTELDIRVLENHVRRQWRGKAKRRMLRATRAALAWAPARLFGTALEYIPKNGVGMVDLA